MRPEIRRHQDAAHLAASVADALVERLAQVQACGRVPAVGLTGGTIAEQIHARLGEVGPGSAVDWSRVDFFWGDERFVAGADEYRNALGARRSFLDVVGADPERIFEMPASDGDLDLAEAAASYGERIRAHGSGAFDVLMLGLGPDGHVASLFPGFPQLHVDDEIAVGVTDSPKPPPQRISLTYPALNRSRAVWFVVSGEGKADAMARALAGAPVEEIPACGVTGTGEVVWFADEAAAGKL